MADLGAFGAAQRELDKTAPRDSFTFFGEQFEVVGAIPAVLMLQLGAAATGKVSEQELFSAIWEALRLSLDEPDRDEAEGEAEGGSEQETPEPVRQFNRLYKIAVAKACDMESLMRLVMTLFQATDGRPTEAAPGSGAGPLSTSPSSSTSSSTLQALPGMIPVSEVLAG